MPTKVAAERTPKDPLTVLVGIGPKRAQAFEEVLGIRTIEQLLRVLPRRYEEVPEEVPFATLKAHDGAMVRIRGTVAGTSVWGRRGRSVLQVKILQGEDSLTALFFNQAYRRKQFVEGMEVFLEGKISAERGLKLLAPRNVSDEEGGAGGLRALYGEHEGLPRGAVRRAISAASAWIPEIPEPLPAEILALADAPPLADALSALHAPQREEDAQHARRRLALGEMLSLELRRRRASPVGEQPVVEEHPELWARILARLPFALNEEQESVLALLRKDLASGVPLRRLLHGEVGSGKTAVAFALALAVAAGGGQVALMAPTELLARQHLRTFRTWLKGSRLQVLGLLGDDPKAERQKALLALRTGSGQIAIGTHALFQREVRFQDLRLVVFDEQHRFGVRQKAALVGKGATPHVLTMTATPIPRTLAWAQYGVLEPCVLRARAGAGAVIHTEVLEATRWRAEAQAVQPRLLQGERAFLVVPRIDGEEGLFAWVDQFFQDGPWAGIPYGIVHGRLPGKDVEAVVRQFQRGQIRVLCGTTVVEVGIDVPGVEHMFLCGAERLGLASVHQLRGRLARGEASRPGRCRLLVKNSESMERLQALEKCHDGFAVAALDLRERGSGTLLGTRQHGASGFSAFDPLKDEDLVQLLRHKELRNWIAHQE